MRQTGSPPPSMPDAWTSCSKPTAPLLPPLHRVWVRSWALAPFLLVVSIWAAWDDEQLRNRDLGRQKVAPFTFTRLHSHTFHSSVCASVLVYVNVTMKYKDRGRQSLSLFPSNLRCLIALTPHSQ